MMIKAQSLNVAPPGSPFIQKHCVGVTCDCVEWRYKAGVRASSACGKNLLFQRCFTQTSGVLTVRRR